MVEAGCVQEKNVINVLFKNVMDAAIAAISFATIGYSLAYGDDGNSFIGSGNFFITDYSSTGTGFHNFFFQWTFSAASATIVSGSVAERCSLEAYFIYSIALTCVIYPVIVHWIWDEQGWLSAFNPEAITIDSLGGGMIDFAGSGVVHMVGGCAGFSAAAIIGPRYDRFEGKAYEPHNQLLAALGCLTTWFGWYGFNCGSTLAVSGGLSTLASRVAVTTTLSGAAGGLTTAALSKLLYKRFDFMLLLNGILGGLVSITAGCPVVSVGSAIFIGLIGGIILVAASKLLEILKVDDPVDASPVHGFCGIWGCLAVGIFATDDLKTLAGYSVNDGTFAIQLVGVLSIIAWVIPTISILFLGMKKLKFVRVSIEMEDWGLDVSEHGKDVYTSEFSQSRKDLYADPELRKRRSNSRTSRSPSRSRSINSRVNPSIQRGVAPREEFNPSQPPPLV